MRKAKGTFWMRAAIFLLAVLFAVLMYWSVGFLLDDIEVFHRPSSIKFFTQRIDSSLQDKLDVLEMQLRELEHKQKLISQQHEFIKDSSSTLEITVDSLFKLKNRDQQLISEEQFEQVLASLDKIVEIQKKYKAMASRYIEITDDKFALEKDIAALKRRMKDRKNAVGKEFSKVVRRHRIKTTIAQTVFVLPLVLVCTVVLIRKRKSIYRTIYGSTALAIYIKTAIFIHERFPTRYFKYIVTGCLLVVVGWGFVWLIRRLARPKVETLLKQYSQAYERFLCPVCEYPIRTGPRRYLYWTRRTAHKVALSGNIPPSDSGYEPYTCPACGTRVFEKCESCGNTRYSLLPNCQVCGAKKEITGDKY